MRRNWIGALLAVGGAGSVGCGTPSSSGVDLSRMAVVGDSLAAGFQDGSLIDTLQPQGFAPLVAVQAQTPMILPLIAPPGIPNVLTLVTAGPPPVLKQASGTSTGRDAPADQPTNLAVPGATLHDALVTRPTLPVDSLTDLVLGVPSLFSGQPARSQVEWVEALRPSAVLLWIGNDDALQAALATDPAKLTAQAQFQSDFNEVVRRMSATHARLVVANLPDPTVVPFFTPAPVVALVVGQPLATIGPPLGLAAGDRVTPDAFPLILAILAGHAQGPLPANVVLTAAEASTIRAAVDGYNGAIAAEAARYDGVVVDIHTRFNEIAANGFKVDGTVLTTAFLGGMFSLDGIHPTSAGYQIIANDFLATMNAKLGTSMPPVKVVAPPPPTTVTALVGRPVTALGVIPDDSVRALRELFGH